MSGKIERECPVCSTVYFVDPVRLERHGAGKTCSYECGRKLTGLKNKRRVSLVCSTCGTEFTRSPAQVKSKHEGVYCSRPCHYAGRSRGTTKRVVTKPYTIVAVRNPEVAKRVWRIRRSNGTDKHNDVTKARLRETTARAIAEGRVPAVSRLEDKVSEVLTDMGISFQRQVCIRDPITGRYGACVDFMLADGRVLEVNGTFWHADPRVYANAVLKPAQVRTLDRWRAKIDLLARLNITPLIVWERDIRDDPRQAVEVVLAGVCQ
jgi:hypothetical protein